MVSPQAPARPKGPQGRRVRVRKWQGTKWSGWRTFQSANKAANWLKVSARAVINNAREVFKSRKFQAKYREADDDLKGERWKQYTNDTKVSNRGRVWNVHSQRKYVPTPDAQGYCYVGNQRLHRIVAELFVPGRSGRRNQVDHIDGNPWNNAAVNLQWVTHKENMQLAAARRAQQDVKLSRVLGDKDDSDEEDEKWKPFKITQAMAKLDTRLAEHVGYDTGWQISNTGRVQDTRGFRRRPTRPYEDGYRRVMIKISDEDNRCGFLVSRLVGWLFLGTRRAGKTQIDHWDGDRGNDRVGNLRWATPAQNRRNQGPGCNR